MGVTVTFSAILELMKEGMLEIVQAQPYAPIHVRPASSSRQLTLVESGDADNEAALAQPAQPEEEGEESEIEVDPAAVTAGDAEAQTTDGSTVAESPLQETPE